MSAQPTPEENAQLLHLVQDCSNNLRHAKGQQWVAGHLTILVYAALVAAAYELASPSRPLSATLICILAGIWLVLVLASGAIGVWMIWDLQRWMASLRKSLSNAEKDFSNRYRQIAGSMHGDEQKYHAVLYRSLHAWLITFVIFVDWLIASTLIFVKFFTR